MRASLLSLATSVLLRSFASADLTTDSFETHVDVLALSSSFDPIKASYWTGLPHHRRTPFALSSSGKSAYLAYLDASGTDVHVQPVDPSTFAATGTVVTVKGAKEAGGLVAHDDGFALLTNEALPSGTANAPAGSTPVAVVYRFDGSGAQTWKTFIGGPSVQASLGLLATPDLNGDLVYSEASGYYAAYFVVTAYTGSASGHFGDAIRYIKASTGALQTISGASSDWGCSHNTGIAFEAADQPPFASICAEDQGAIWLNTKGQGMTTVGVKISNENTTNGASNEPMGGMSGSYSALARFGAGSKYIFAWVSRGAMGLTENTWMGSGYTHSNNRTNGRNVAIALFSDKNTLVGPQATSQVGAKDGDSQINWITQGTADCNNAHAATFDDSNALISWEEIANPKCNFIAMGCQGAFSGSKFQQVTSDGKKVGSSVSFNNVYVSGDMVTMSSGRICWPYVSGTWNLDKTVRDGASGTTTTKMSFACARTSGSASNSSSTSDTASSSASAAASSATVAAAAASKAPQADAVDPSEQQAAAPSQDPASTVGATLPDPSATAASSAAQCTCAQSTAATVAPALTSATYAVSSSSAAAVPTSGKTNATAIVTVNGGSSIRGPAELVLAVAGALLTWQLL